jgi:hypothetical protein
MLNLEVFTAVVVYPLVEKFWSIQDSTLIE